MNHMGGAVMSIEEMLAAVEAKLAETVQELAETKTCARIELERKDSMIGGLAQDVVASNARVEEAEQKLAAAEREIRHRERKTAELVEKLAAAERRYEATEQHVVIVREQREAAEARVRELTGEWADLHVQLTAAESRLATATELLGTARHFLVCDPALGERIDDFLDNQPAAPYGTPDESPGFNAAWPLGKAQPAAPTSAESELAQLRERVAKATTWLVTVKSDQPASIIADRARLALEALRGPK